ncbi:hypothetical protein B0H11DRAFT_2254753 [Mycena galericulata]|nr:hypothetical protein B0H11DRAFT_2254753 [Mycena galericulata]
MATVIQWRPPVAASELSSSGFFHSTPLSSPFLRVWDHLAERPRACTSINIPTRSQYPAAHASNDLSILEATPLSDLAGLMNQHLHLEASLCAGA